MSGTQATPGPSFTGQPGRILSESEESEGIQRAVLQMNLQPNRRTLQIAYILFEIYNAVNTVAEKSSAVIAFQFLSVFVADLDSHAAITGRCSEIDFQLAAGW